MRADVSSSSNILAFWNSWRQDFRLAKKTELWLSSQGGRTVELIEPVVLSNRNSQTVHAEKIDSSVGLLNGAAEKMRCLGAIQGEPVFNSQAVTTVYLTTGRVHWASFCHSRGKVNV